MTTTMTIPEFTADQLTAALRTAKPVDPEAAHRAQADADAALDAAFSRIRTATP